MLRYEFRFWQEDRLVYFGDQSAIFVKGRAFEEISSRSVAGET